MHFHYRGYVYTPYYWNKVVGTWNVQIHTPEGEHVKTLPRTLGHDGYISEDAAAAQARAWVDVEIDLEQHYAEVAAEWGI